MKSAIIYGGIIGGLSILWLVLAQALGYTDIKDNHVSPMDYVSILIPLTGLYFGVRSYRNNELGGHMEFLQALMQSFRILIIGGAIAVFGGIIYTAIQPSLTNIADISGRIFGALLVGITLALGVSLLLMTRNKRVG